MKVGSFPTLAHGKALYVGDPVAVVLADSYAEAKDGARGSSRGQTTAC